MSDKPKRKLYKDWFDKDAALMLAEQLSRVYPEFQSERFIRLALENLLDLEFKARVQQFAAALKETLPHDIPKALQVLTQSLPQPLPNCESPTDGWLQWPVGEFIALYAVDHFEAATEAMIELTRRFSSEFAVRPFVEKYPERTQETLLELTKHNCPHVRRWCSEGMRPRLPWGSVLRDLVADPAPIWPVLEALKDDPELYVRRSVANNINDIAKDHPAQVVKKMKLWNKSAKAPRKWLIKHGLRSLIKKADPGALEIMGFAPPKAIKLTLNLEPARVELGESVKMSLSLTSTSQETQRLQVDYLVHFVKQAGKTAEKVFKWKTLELKSGEVIRLEKNHPMRQTSARRLYSGTHKIDLQINGERFSGSEFQFSN